MSSLWSLTPVPLPLASFGPSAFRFPSPGLLRCTPPNLPALFLPLFLQTSILQNAIRAVPQTGHWSAPAPAQSPQFSPDYLQNNKETLQITYKIVQEKTVQDLAPSTFPANFPPCPIWSCHTLLPPLPGRVLPFSQARPPLALFLPLGMSCPPVFRPRSHPLPNPRVKATSSVKLSWTSSLPCPRDHLFLLCAPIVLCPSLQNSAHCATEIHSLADLFPTILKACLKRELIYPPQHSSTRQRFDTYMGSENYSLIQRCLQLRINHNPSLSVMVLIHDDLLRHEIWSWMNYDKMRFLPNLNSLKLFSKVTWIHVLNSWVSNDSFWKKNTMK